mmetsp:Transcript_62397/g.182323  ORF Transcript_62397/g.182323 Transcript_62397/m.182323 type:complete len:309 (-) Transcript_62397:720-1646(-)
MVDGTHKPLSVCGIHSDGVPLHLHPCDGHTCGCVELAAVHGGNHPLPHAVAPLVTVLADSDPASLSLRGTGRVTPHKHHAPPKTAASKLVRQAPALELWPRTGISAHTREVQHGVVVGNAKDPTAGREDLVPLTRRIPVVSVLEMTSPCVEDLEEVHALEGRVLGEPRRRHLLHAVTHDRVRVSRNQHVGVVIDEGEVLTPSRLGAALGSSQEHKPLAVPAHRTGPLELLGLLRREANEVLVLEDADAAVPLLLEQLCYFDVGKKTQLLLPPRTMVVQTHLPPAGVTSRMAGEVHTCVGVRERHLPLA